MVEPGDVWWDLGILVGSGNKQKSASQGPIMPARRDWTIVGKKVLVKAFEKAFTKPLDGFVGILSLRSSQILTGSWDGLGMILGGSWRES